MSQKYEKLKALLQELFQLDQPDLDFGIYRILHAKADEITNFLDRDLLPQVKEAFGQYKSADKAEIEREIEHAIASAKDLGIPDPESTEKVKQLRERLATEAVDVSKIEGEVYDNLFSFFRRYYSEGDFLSKRVYKPGVYAIPYEGEEIKLHWANADQYYIKTSEYLRDYAFRLNAEADEDKGEDPMRVHFRLVDATEGEHGNVKEANGKTRVFILANSDFVAEEDGKAGKELVIAFEYRPATLSDWPADERNGKKKPPAQKELLEIAEKNILAVEDAALVRWIAELRKNHIKASGEQADYSRLRAHLNRYTARNTFDYFIHKDLGGFLRRELDFYIKNEVMYLDDIESDTAPRVEQYLSKIKVIRKIAHKLIDVLDQIEDFQKRLWLKKKFVVETNYCVTTALVPHEFYREIAANVAQVSEWEELFRISGFEDFTGIVDEEFLAGNPGLPVNTVHFAHEFKERIAETLSNTGLYENGILIHSDNFQALRLGRTRFQKGTDGIYIDPPYNTDVSSIPYKNDYKHSSFASLIADRSRAFWPWLSDKGVLYVSIDKHERSTVEFSLNDVFGSENKVEELIWVQNTNDGRSPTFSVNHEYVEVYARNLTAAENDHRIFRIPKPGYLEVSDLIQSFAGKFPPIAEIENKLQELYRDHRISYRATVQQQGLDWEQEKRNDPWNGIYLYKHAEYRDSDGRLVSEEGAREACADIWVYRESDWTIMSSDDKQSSTIKDPNHPNYRFYQPTHPITGKPCAMPSRGWKGTQFVDPAHPSRNSWESLLAKDLIAFGPDETKVPQHKRMLRNVETNVAKSVFADYSDGEKETTALFGRTGVFLAPKHTNFVRRLLSQFVRPGSVVLDCFGGSGSTAHAVIRMNREERLDLKFILVEVNKYFDDILVPRVLKGAFASDWENGSPASRDYVAQVVKIVRLESYEDALNNLELRRSNEQEGTLFSSQADGPNRFREQYMLRYMLDVESRGSQSLLNIEKFADPTAYKLKVKRPGSDESREVNVDLIETFNWLIGLTVQHIAAPHTFAADFERDTEGRLQIADRLRQDANGPFWFRTVTGTTPDGRKTLVIWRKLTGNPEEDNLVLDEWFTRQGYSSKDSEFDLIYVNGDNNLENLRAPDDTSWKVRLIEEDFHRLMFDTEDV